MRCSYPASNRNEYQEHILGGGGVRRPVPRAGLATFHLHVSIALKFGRFRACPGLCVLHMMILRIVFDVLTGTLT